MLEGGKLLAVPQHPVRNCIYTEVTAARKGKLCMLTAGCCNVVVHRLQYVEQIAWMILLELTQ